MVSHSVQLIRGTGYPSCAGFLETPYPAKRAEVGLPDLCSEGLRVGGSVFGKYDGQQSHSFSERYFLLHTLAAVDPKD